MMSRTPVTRALLAIACTVLAGAPADAAGWRWYVDTNRDGTSEFNAYFGQGYDTCLPGDYDGDGRADYGVVRTTSSSWRWFMDTNRDGHSELHPDLTDDASGGTRFALDMDGDGRDDLVTVQKEGAAWRWSIDTNRDGVPNVSLLFGFVDTDDTGEDRTDRLVPADYDGNGAVDIAIARKAGNGRWRWYVDTNRNGVTNVQYTFGVADIGEEGTDTSDIPEPHDYDGDGAADPAVRRAVDGWWTWYADTDRDGVSEISQTFGKTGDIPFPADYDGDGVTDFAVVRRDGANWRWYVDTDRNGASNINRTFGLVIDHPVPADYDGDGRTDFAVVRPQWSTNTYRLPAADGKSVKVSRDSYGHWPDKENFDLVITPSNQSHGVVAAAYGVVAFIEDDYDEECPQGESGDCNDNNNYVWLVHPGGEWTKYTHVAKDSVRLFAGLSEGDVVFAGQIIGIQSDIGLASGKHVHFEVGVPFDADDPITGGGWLKGYSLAPRFCNVPGQVLTQGVTYVAAPCAP